MALSQCSPALRWWTLSRRCSVLCPRSSRSSTAVAATATAQFLRPHAAALFHQNNVKASPDSNKPASVISSGVELFGMGIWSLGLGAIGAALTGIFLANTDLCLTKAAKAMLENLGDADLRSTTEDDKVIKAKSLWEKNGAVVMAEASELSSLKPQLEELGVPLIAVTKENVGSEIQDFRPHFAGDIYVDEKRCFYGPQQRRMGGLGFFRLGVWQNFMRAWRSGYQGNMIGEGFILGGVYVIGAGDQGILLEHHEKEFGNKVDAAQVLEAVKKIVPLK